MVGNVTEFNPSCRGEPPDNMRTDGAERRS
jgi:hypothetical protein